MAHGNDFVARERANLRAEIEFQDGEYRQAMADLYAAAGQANTQEMNDMRRYADECKANADRARSNLASLAMCF